MLEKTGAYNAEASDFLHNILSLMPDTTNTAIINKAIEVLKLDKLANNAQDENVKVFFDKLRNDALDTQTLKFAIESSLLNNPLIKELIDKIIEKGLHISLFEQLDTNKGREFLKKQINLLYLFEGLTVTMANSKSFLSDVLENVDFIKKRIGKNPYYSAMRALFSGMDFEKIKAMSVDPGLTSYAFMRTLGDEKDPEIITAQAENFIKKFNLQIFNQNIIPDFNGQNRSGSNRSIGLNILEAVCSEEYNSGKNKASQDNASAGFGLIAVMEDPKANFENYPAMIENDEKAISPDGFGVKDGNYDVVDIKVDTSPKYVHKYDVTKEWMDLYNSWNLLFVLSNVNQEYIPLKLLLPSVMGANPSHFMETRIQALGLMGNLYLDAKKTNAEYFQNSITFAPETIREIQQLWGTINKEHADTMIQEKCQETEKWNGDSEMVKKECISGYLGSNWPMTSLFGKMAQYARNSKKFQITKPLTTQQDASAAIATSQTAREPTKM